MIRRTWGRFWLWLRKQLVIQTIGVAPADAEDYVAGEWCAIHGHEPIPPDGVYRMCGECWHAYLTPQEFVDEHNRVLHELANAPHEWNFPGVLPTPLPGDGADDPWGQDPLQATYTIRASNIRMRALDGNGEPVGPAIPMPDAEMEVSYRPFPLDMYKIEYQPLTVDQVDTITICPLCTHDF